MHLVCSFDCPQDKVAVDRDIGHVNDVLALQKQGEAQMGAYEYEKAKASFREGLAIEPENDALKVFLEKATTDAAKWVSAEELEDQGIALFQGAPQDVPGAVAKFEAALKIWPEHARALEWLGRCSRLEHEETQRIAAAAPPAAEAPAEVEVVVVEQKAIDVTIKTEENKEIIVAAAKKAAEAVFRDLKIEPTPEGLQINASGAESNQEGKLNFMRFMRWWQKQLHTKGAGSSRIQDEELQVCQSVWHDYDDDGCVRK